MDDDPQVSDRDDHYVKYANGVVYDSKTGLEWIAGPGRHMSWDEAREWAEGIETDGGGWRMPKRKELETLYQEGKDRFQKIHRLTKDQFIASASRCKAGAFLFD